MLNYLLKSEYLNLWLFSKYLKVNSTKYMLPFLFTLNLYQLYPKNISILEVTESITLLNFVKRLGKEKTTDVVSVICLVCNHSVGVKTSFNVVR